MLALLLILFLPFLAQGQGAGQPMVRNMAEMRFTTFPGLPTCTTAAVQSGDPTKGPSVILAKQAAGCTIPWHWHTPTESLMIVSGVARMEMKDGKSITLRAGGFALVPSHHVHLLRCTSACTLFVHSDAPLDTHYVDAKGKEISPAAAMKAVGETAATEMK